MIIFRDQMEEMEYDIHHNCLKCCEYVREVAVCEMYECPLHKWRNKGAAQHDTVQSNH